VSSNYLPKKLNDNNFLNYLKVRKLTRIKKENLLGFSGCFMPASHLEKFDNKSIDYFISIANFQEMTLEQVELYFDLIDQKVSNLFYTQQYWKITNNRYRFWHKYFEMTSYTKYPIKKNWENIHIDSTIWSDLYFEAIFRV
jgi:hypothetical protein